MATQPAHRRRTPFITLLALTIAATVSVVGLAQTSASAAVATYRVMNTSETLPDGVWFRNSPVNSDTNRETGFGVYAGESLAVDCWAWGDPVGSYNNHIWYRGLDVNRPTINGHANYGYLNTHYVNDGMTADHAAPGIPSCTTGTTTPPPPPPPPPSVTPCVLPLRWAKLNLTWNYSGKHRYLGNAYQAAKNWSNLNTGIRITQVPASTPANITFNDKNLKSQTGLYGRAEIPSQYTAAQTTQPSKPWNPTHIDITVNQAAMDTAGDFVRTFALTHEVGHALGLAHTDLCTSQPTSVMKGGFGGWFLSATFNTPQYYDKVNLQQLYGLPTG